jgi:hypothetical protein
MIERRRHYDPTPRAQVAVATIDNTKLVQTDSYAHAALLGLGFEEIMRCEPDCVLLRAPHGWETDEHGYGRNTAPAS